MKLSLLITGVVANSVELRSDGTLELNQGNRPHHHAHRESHKRRVHSYMEQGASTAPAEKAIDPQRPGAMEATKNYKSALDKKFKKLDEDGQRWESWNMEIAMAGNDLPAYLDGICSEIEMQSAEMSYAILESVTLQRANVDELREALKPIMNQATKDDLEIISDMDSIVRNLEKDLGLLDDEAKVAAEKVDAIVKMNSKEGKQQAQLAARTGERTLERVTNPGILSKCTACCGKCQGGLAKWDPRLASKAEKYAANVKKWSDKVTEYETEMSGDEEASSQLAMETEAGLSGLDEEYMTVQSQQDEEIESAKSDAELATSAAEDLSDVEVTKAEGKSTEAVNALEGESEASALRAGEAVDAMTEDADSAVSEVEAGARAGEDAASATGANGASGAASSAEQAAVEAQALTAQLDELGVTAEQLSEMTQEETVAFLKKVLEDRGDLAGRSQANLEELAAAFRDAATAAKNKSQNDMERAKDQQQRAVDGRVAEDENKMSTEQKSVDAMSDNSLGELSGFIGGLGGRLGELVNAERDEEKATTREGKEAEKMRSTLLKYASQALQRTAAFAQKWDRKAAALEKDADKTSKSERGRIEQEKSKAVQEIIAAAAASLKLVQQTNTAAKQQVLGATSQSLDPEAIISQVEKVEARLAEIENEEIGESVAAVTSAQDKANTKVEEIVPETEEETKRAEETVLKDTTSLRTNQEAANTQTAQTIENLIANGVKRLTDYAEKIEGSYTALGETVDSWKTDEGNKLTTIDEQVKESQDNDDTEKQATTVAIDDADAKTKQADELAKNAELQEKVSVENMGSVAEEDITAASSRADSKAEEVINMITKASGEDKAKLQKYLTKQNAETGAKILAITEKIKEESMQINPDSVNGANKVAEAQISQGKQVFDANSEDIMATVDDMNKDVNKWEERTEDEMGKYRENLNSVVTKAKDATLEQAEDKASQANALVTETVKKENDKQTLAEQSLKEMSVQLQSTMGEEGELFKQEKDQLEAGEAAVEKDADAVDAEGNSAINQVATKSQAAKANFEASMGRDGAAQGRAEASLAAKSGEVEEEVAEGEQAAVHEAGEKSSQWKQQGDEMLEEIADAEHKGDRAWKKAGKSQQQLQAEANDVDHKTESIEQETDADEQEEMEKVQKFARTFISTLEHSKKQHIDIGNEVQSETRKLLGDSESGLSTWRNLAGHVTDVAKASVANVGADERQMDRGLEDLLKLEEYQDEEALERVKGDQDTFAANIDTMTNWRTKTSANTQQFWNDVKDLFADFNSQLNIEELENGEATAAESWHIQRQMAALGEGLEGELGDMSHETTLQLALLAKQSGAEIAALMADQSKSAEEKAKLLAKIKADARARAAKLLEANGRVDLDATTNKRKLEAATKEVQDAISRIANLDSTKLSFSKDTHINEAMDIIKDLVAQTNAMITNGLPSSSSAPAEGDGDSSLLQTGARERRGAELRELRQAQVEDAEALANLRKSRQ